MRQKAQGEEVLKSLTPGQVLVKIVKEELVKIMGEANEALNDEPGKVNSDPEGDGWFFKMKIEDTSVLDDLMDEAAETGVLEETTAPIFASRPMERPLKTASLAE